MDSGSEAAVELATSPSGSVNSSGSLEHEGDASVEKIKYKEFGDRSVSKESLVNKSCCQPEESKSPLAAARDKIKDKWNWVIDMVRRGSPNENTRLLGSQESQYHTAPSGSGSSGGQGVSSSGESYEELFKDSVPCPSCRGLGRVPKELENQLVALIPLQDDRLKPRRTILWVSIAVSLCAITAGLLIFFLMPRNITISSNRPLLQPTFIYVNATPPDYFANFTVVNHYNVSNSNFYPVTISGVFMKSLYSNAIIAQATAYKMQPLSIPARSDAELSIPIDFILAGEHRDLAQHCTSHWTWIHNLPILFDVTANYTYMGHSEQATLTTFQMVSCYPPPKPLTTVPPTTTPLTTTTLSTTTVPTTTPTTTALVSTVVTSTAAPASSSAAVKKRSEKEIVT